MPIAIADWRKRYPNAIPRSDQQPKISQLAPAALRMSIAAGQVAAWPSMVAMIQLQSAATAKNATL